MRKLDIESLIKEGVLSNQEKLALNQLTNHLTNNWPGTKLRLFGSKVKGTADKESDIDVLILLPCEVTEELRRQIIHIIFDVNLASGTNISALILSEKEWDSGKFSILPIHSVIEEEGVPLHE